MPTRRLPLPFSWRKVSADASEPQKDSVSGPFQIYLRRAGTASESGKDPRTESKKLAGPALWKANSVDQNPNSDWGNGFSPPR